MPGFTSIHAFLARSQGGVAIRMFSITMLPSAGWLAMEYARKIGSGFFIFRSQSLNLSHSGRKSCGSTAQGHQFGVRGDVDVLEVHLAGWHIDLDVSAGLEVAGARLRASFTTNSLMKLATL